MLNNRHKYLFKRKIVNIKVAKLTRSSKIIIVILLLLLPLSELLQYLGKMNPETVEFFYSRYIYRVISLLVSRYYSLFPFSVAEIMLYCLLVLALFIIVESIIYICRRQFKALRNITLFTACIVTTGLFLFTIMWGLNYYRLPLAQNLDYKTGNPTTAELTAMLQNEKNAINSLCASGSIRFNSLQQSYYVGGFSRLRVQVQAGYAALAASTPLQNTLFGGNKPSPKPILASKLMSYTGIEGIFIPFTYEPNVNTDDPTFVIPFDAAHESAHFKGFAREDEANFIAYLADTANPDPYFQYSAHMVAYLYISNALYQTDSAAAQQIGAQLDNRAKGDFVYYNNFLLSHQSRAQDVSTKINNSYLKSQGQQGVISYDMFVNLLADRYRTRNS